MIHRSIFFKHCLKVTSFVTKFISTRTFPYEHNGLLSISIPQIGSNIKLLVQSTWNEGCSIDGPDNILDQIHSHYDHTSKHSSIKVDEYFKSNTPITLNLSVPEHCNIDIKADDLDITTTKKIQGNITIEAKKGQMKIDKLRGEHVNLTLWEGDIHIKRVIEGNITINSSQLYAKMINGNMIKIHTLATDIEALYGQNIDIVSYSSINIGLLKGQAKIVSDCGDIKLSGIDGTVHTHAHKGMITAQINRVDIHPMDNSGFTAIADYGFIMTEIDPNIACDVKLECGSSLPGEPGIADVESSYFIPDETRSSIGRIVGYMTGGVPIENAMNHNKGSNSNNDSKNTTESNLSPEKLTSGKINVHETRKVVKQGPIHLKGMGLVKLESKSWIENIKKKYGF